MIPSWSAGSWRLLERTGEAEITVIPYGVPAGFLNRPGIPGDSNS